MIHLLPLSRVLTWLAISYAVIIAGIISFVPGTFAENVGIALEGWTILHLTILIFIYFGWRKVWKKFPFLESWIFPDLNGEWEINIHWLGAEDKNGIVNGTCTIKVDFFKVSLVVKTQGSDSVTLCVRLAKNSESGCPTLHYLYRVTPKFMKNEEIHFQEEYNGAAILTLDKDCNNTLSGNYFTDRYTKGHFVIKRIT